MELPHDSNGDLDWNTLGNILTAHILGEVLHAKFVDWKYGRTSRDIAVDTSWQFSHEKDDIMVLKKTYTNSPLLAFMGRGVIELPMEEVARFIRDISHRENWDRHLVDITILRELSSTDFLVRMHHRARKCVIRAERDWLYYERACHVDDKFVMTALSVDLPEYPPIPGITRAKILPGSGWVLEPYDGSRMSTLVSYVAHVDLKGLPPIIVNHMQRKQIMAVHYIREILTPDSSSPSITSRQKKGVKKKGDSESIESLPQELDNQSERESGGIRVGPSGNGTRNIAAPFEDPVSVYAFIRSSGEMSRQESLPWDMAHRWNGDKHSHAHLEAIEVGAETERVRSYSEGETASPHSIPVVKSTLLQQIAEDSEDKGQVT